MNAGHIIVHVRLTARAARLADFEQLLAGHAEASRLEAGCLRFDVLHDEADPCAFALDEAWLNADALDAHKRTPHYLRWRAESPSLLAGERRHEEYVRWGRAATPSALETLAALARSRRLRGERVAFTNGCFDVLHAGHVQLLREARAQADCLVVGLNSDASVRALKGEGRPVQPLADRRAVLEALGCVDLVVPFDTLTPLALVEVLRPDVLVKGGDYARSEVVGADLVESYGGRVHLARRVDGLSTTSLIRRLKAV